MTNQPEMTGKINDLFKIVHQLAAELNKTVIQRDRQGGTAKAERDLIRQSGLLTISIPEKNGGWGLEWPVILKAVRILAQVDSSLAHLLGFHYLQLASIDFFGSSEQREELYQVTLDNNWFWGNALNSVSSSTTAIKRDDYFILNGKKLFCSGATDADMLLVSAHEGEKLIVAAIPANRKGIQINQDWDSFGQRQTDSGSVDITNLNVYQNEILTTPGPMGSIRATLRTSLTQLLLSNIYLGIAEGAFAEAKQYTTRHSRPWIASGVERASDDPFVLHNYGNMWVQLQASEQLNDYAATSFQQCLNLGENITADRRGACAIAIATAKVFTSRSALEISTKIFEVAGARATAGTKALDRYWRNLRTHTLHDPIDYKLKELGNWALNAELPVPGIYS